LFQEEESSKVISILLASKQATASVFGFVLEKIGKRKGCSRSA
jgi:hypothetical protein